MQKNIVSKVNNAMAGQSPKTQQQFNEHVARMKQAIDELKQENEKFSCTIREMQSENEELKKKIEELAIKSSTSTKKKKSKSKRNKK